MPETFKKGDFVQRTLQHCADPTIYEVMETTFIGGLVAARIRPADSGSRSVEHIVTVGGLKRVQMDAATGRAVGDGALLPTRAAFFNEPDKTSSTKADRQTQAYQEVLAAIDEANAKLREAFNLGVDIEAVVNMIDDDRCRSGKISVRDPLGQRPPRLGSKIVVYKADIALARNGEPV